MAKYVVDSTDLTSVADAIRTKGGIEEDVKLVFPTGFVSAVEAISGGGLNFTVVGGTTRPENPAENTIWVNTETEIGVWNIAPTCPTAAEDGDVWIHSSGSGNCFIETLTENSLVVYILRAKQYVYGAWEEKEVSLWKDGEWTVVIGDLVLLENCVVETLRSGGFELTNTATMDDKGIYLGGSNSLVITKNKIDLSPYDTMIVYAFNSAHISSSIGISETPDSYVASVNVANYTGSPQLHQLDISSYDGEYYIRAYGANSTYTSIILKLGDA